MKKAMLFVVLLLVLVLSVCASAAVPIERNKSDEIPYALAQSIFAENEDCLRMLCTTMLERQTDQLDIRYIEGEDNVYSIQVWEKRGDEYAHTTVPAYTAIVDLEYDLSLFNELDRGMVPILNIVRRDNVVDIALGTYSNFQEPFGNCDSVLTFNSAINILNTFSYCCNCASNMSDHSGTMSEWEILGFVYDGSAGDFRRLEQGLPPQAYENWLKSGGTRNTNLVVRDDELVKRTITSITYYPAEIANDISYDMMSQLSDSSLLASLGDIILGILISRLPGSTTIGIIDTAGSLIKLFDSEKYKAEVRWFRSAHEIDEDTLSGVLIVTTDSIYYDTGTIIENFREFYSWNGSGNPFANPVPPTPLFQDL